MLAASRPSCPPTADPASLSSFPFDPTASPCPSNVVVSPLGTIHVLGYTPSEGERGVPITVRIHFQPDVADAMYVRLVVGHKAIATKVRELPNFSYGRWQLDANIPTCDPQLDTKVLLQIQALNENSDVLDSVIFGEFSYWSSGLASPKERNIAARRPPRLQIPSSLPETTGIRRRSATYRQLSKSPISPTGITFPQPNNLRLQRRIKSQSLMRTKNVSFGDSSDNLYAQTPILELVTPLSSVCTGWTAAELQSGRRLVRFSKVQDGRRLIVSCEPIRQDEYCESDSVISCIFREETQSCFVTSVDVIYLLERLTNGEFPVEEKNRIRRNLEGLRPTTVSKHKSGFGEFFQRIMEFPDPKPRNIEKDLKVFEWNLLGQALEKILSKYSIYTTSSPVSGESTPVDTPGNTSPNVVPLKTLYTKGESGITTVPSSEPISIPQKYESTLDDIPFISPSSGSDTFSSPAISPITTSPSTSLYPLLTDGIDAHTSEAASASWETEYKPSDLGLDALSLLSNYDTLDSGNSAVPNFSSDNNSYDYRFYDGFSFGGIVDDGLGAMANHYQV